MVSAPSPLLPPTILEDSHGNTWQFAVARLIASPPAIPGVYVLAGPPPAPPPKAVTQDEEEIAELAAFFGRRPARRCTVVYVGEADDLDRRLREHRAQGGLAEAERLGATTLLLLFLPEVTDEARRELAEGLIGRYRPVLNRQDQMHPAGTASRHQPARIDSPEPTAEELPPEE